MCKHEQFYVEAKVARLTETEEPDASVTGHSANIKIVCIQCHKYFRFIGVPGGYSPSRPMVNFDETELRAPIEPNE